MKHKVIPFSVRINNGAGETEMASQVAAFIESEATDGWEFVSSGNIDTQIAGTNGCFGFGATPASSKSHMVMIFKK